MSGSVPLEGRPNKDYPRSSQAGPEAVGARLPEHLSLDGPVRLVDGEEDEGLARAVPVVESVRVEGEGQVVYVGHGQPHRGHRGTHGQQGRALQPQPLNQRDSRTHSLTHHLEECGLHGRTECAHVAGAAEAAHQGLQGCLANGEEGRQLVQVPEREEGPLCGHGGAQQAVPRVLQRGEAVPVEGGEAALGSLEQLQRPHAYSSAITCREEEDRHSLST